MHYTDRQLGWAAFSLTYILKGVFAPSPKDVLYVPSVLGYNANGGNSMKPVSLITFSRFCVAGQNVREEIVDNFREYKHRNPDSLAKSLCKPN